VARCCAADRERCAIRSQLTLSKIDAGSAAVKAHFRYSSELGSGLTNYSQKMTAAAMQIAEKKVWAQRSYRVWTRLQSLSRPNMFSILWRCL